MDGLLGKLDSPHEKSIFTAAQSANLFDSSFMNQNGDYQSNQQPLNLYQSTNHSSTFISPAVSIPNPKRSNPIDFLGINDMNTGLMTNHHARAQQSNHDRFGSSFSHLATESRSELSALGVSISRAKSSDAPTPELTDPLNLHHNGLWPHSRPVSLSNLQAISENSISVQQQRVISPNVGNLGGLGGINDWRADGHTISNIGLSTQPADNRFDSRGWPFVDKPPGLLSRAASSLAISTANAAGLNEINRPVSTPAYLNKNNDSLPGLALGLELGLGQQSNQSALLTGINGRESLLQTSLNNNEPPRFGTLGSELSHLGNPLTGFPGLTLESNEESRWPKPVRYARPLDTTDHIYGSVIRPPSSSADAPTRSSGLSPLSNTDRFSISPKPTTDRSPLENKSISVSREVTPPPISSRISPKLSINAVDDRAIENVIATNCHHILLDAAEHSLKAVELANTLRARVGTEVLAIVRERWGGLLSLLERHSEKFLVERIPKNDRVSLYSAKHAEGIQSQAALNETIKDFLEKEDMDGMTADPQQASRCLHVGNVPSSYTEVQLMREFEKFGQLDGLKLITQKNGNRRFAFVTFKTVAQAITARHCLSKVHPWKSAISFAHRDFSNNKVKLDGNNQIGGSGTASAQQSSNSSSMKNSPQKNSPSQSHHNGNDGSGNTYQHTAHQHQNRLQQNLNPFNNHERAWDNHQLQQFHQQQQQQQHQQQQHQQQQHQMNSNHDTSNFNGESVFFSDRFSGKPSGFTNGNHSNGIDNHRSGTHQTSNANTLLSPSSSNPFSYSNVAAKNTQEHHSLKHDGSGGSTGLIGTHPTIDNFPDKPALQIILNRLCDDTYVPTQPWPIDAVADVPFCQAVLDQVSHFGGSTTISKLRGFLKHRVGTTDNIKSVPLKAMLLAYPNLFRVEGNLVSLVNANPI